MLYKCYSEKNKNTANSENEPKAKILEINTDCESGKWSTVELITFRAKRDGFNQGRSLFIP
jgi:hypothetical protein